MASEGDEKCPCDLTSVEKIFFKNGRNPTWICIFIMDSYVLNNFSLWFGGLEARKGKIAKNLNSTVFPLRSQFQRYNFDQPWKVVVGFCAACWFWAIFVNMALTTSNHNKKLFRTYELLMLADIHVGFRPFLKNIVSTEVRSRRPKWSHFQLKNPQNSIKR